MATILLAGHDAAPTRAFRKLEGALLERGHRVITHLLDTGKFPLPPLKLLGDNVAQADVCLIGMSTPSDNAWVELHTASFARQYGKPFGFYADTHGAHNRPHFYGYRRTADFLFTVSESEMRSAADVFDGARIFPTGNPLWGAFFEPADRETARSHINARPEDFVIMVPGTKDQQHNLTYLAATIYAARYVSNPLIVFSLHPGDKNDRGPYLGCYEQAKGTGVRMMICDPGAGDPRTSDMMLPGADVVVNGVSVRVHALARRIPAIDYFTGYSRVWLKKDTGMDHGYFFGSGAVVDIYDGSPHDLGKALDAIQREPTMLREAQTGIIPQRSENAVLSRMCGALIAIAENRALVT